jgi:hypothetical protein
MLTHPSLFLSSSTIFHLNTTFDDMEYNNYNDARGYHRRALQFRDSGKDPGLVFNVAAIAIERYLVALCDLHGVEPMNHNFVSLIKDVERLMEVPHELSRDIRSLDHIFGICFLDTYHHGDPDVNDMEKAIRICDDVQQLFDKEKKHNV